MKEESSTFLAVQLIKKYKYLFIITSWFCFYFEKIKKVEEFEIER